MLVAVPSSSTSAASNTMTNPDELGYNGWANYETWNVTLWIGNDEGLESLARDAGSYKNLVAFLTEELDNHYTPDGVPWKDSAIDEEEVDKMIAEL